MGFTQIVKRNGETIQLNTNEPFCFVKEATLTSSLMGDDYISLKIVSSNWLSFAKGDKITVGGKEYCIRATTTREIVSDGYYNYEPVFYGVMYDLMKTIYRNCDMYGKSDKSTFDLTYTIKEFVQVLIYNMERDYPGLWKFDAENCPETEAKTIQFSGVNCLQALQTLCSSAQFDLEFQITQEEGVRTIHIGKFGKRINPPSGAAFFEWGKGNGLYNLKEQKIDDKAVITRLWVEGGTTNIRSNYRDYAERLQLPLRRMNQYEHTLSDGTIVKPNSEMIGIEDDSKRYIEDAELRDKIGSEEDVKTYDDIYPTRTGKVTAIVDDDICAFVDDTMDFDLNEKDDKGTKYLVDGVSAKITFTSGRLAGQQFELDAKGGYDNATKKFKIIPFTDSRGLTIPSQETQNAYKIEVGNTYKITDIYLPEQYETKAEEELWYAGNKDFKDAKQVKAQYALTFDRLYFLQTLSRDTETSVFEVGDYVPVKDTRFGIEKTMRIQKVTRNLLLEHDYQVTLADSTAISIQTQTVISVIDHENIINNNRLRDLNKARRGWRTTEDLRSMVYDTDGYFDNENIRPNSIDTNMLTVGSKSQQFVLSGCVLQANYNGNPNMFVATKGVLSHLTIDSDKIRSWQLEQEAFTLQNTGGYYLFAKCSKSGESAVWYMTQEQLKVEPTSDPNNYYFQVGILSSLYADDNFRDFQTTYGFTRINGNTITTGRIITSDGECYLDLDGNKFRIGDESSSIDWNVTKQGQLSLKNVSVVSGSGDVSPIGVYRGVWNKDYIYYKGDEVAYTSNGATCTYRYIHATPSKGNLPTNSVYWEVLAKGEKGDAGVNSDWVSFVFKQSETKPNKPTGTSPIPQGWSDAPTATGKWWMSKAVINGTTGKAGSWSEPVQTTAEDGVDGAYTDFKYAKNTSSTSTPTIIIGDRNPLGWADEPPTLSDGEYLWMSQAEINADNTLKSSWSTPVRISGEKGDAGTNGSTFYFIYTLGTSTPTTPTFQTPQAITQQTLWRTTPPTPTTTYFLYMSQAVYNPNRGMFGLWSTPVRISGTNGKNGEDGTDIEFIYKRNTGDTPSKPTSVNTDDYVPDGWTDNPSGITETYKYEWVCVRTKPKGASSWSEYSTPVVWAKWGDKGQDGDGVEYVFKRTEVETAPSAILVSSVADKFVPTGWTDEPSGVSADYPFEWVSMRQKTNGVWGAFSAPKLWANYTVWNPNLLEQSDFENWQKMDKWVTKSLYHGTTKADESVTHILPNGLEGRNYYYDVNTKRNDECAYKEVLQQALRTSTIKKLQPSTWYTFSFWERCGANILQINQTSSAYGFARQTLYLFKGQSYKIAISGRIDAQALTDGKSLAVFIFNSDWSWNKSVMTANTANTIMYLNFDDVPSDGTYYLMAYLYNNAEPRTGTATLNWVRIEASSIFTTYIYPSAIDRTKVFVDGVQYDNSIGADCAVNYPSNGVWKKHTITFKTKASFASDELVLFRLLPIAMSGSTYYLHICMPKLEVGKVATSYSQSSDDLRSDYQEYRFAKNGSRNSAPDLVNTDAEPNGWTTIQPSVGTLEYLWMIVAKKSATGALLTNWSTPVRVTPYDGKDGENGKSPVLAYQGEYDSNKTYYGTDYRLDAVKYNGVYYVARIDAGLFYNVEPTDTSKWNEFGTQFESVATNLLLAEFAYIDNLGVRNLQTAQNGSRVHISAEDNAMTIYDKDGQTSAVFSGDQFTDSQLFGGAELTVTPKNFSMAFQTGNALHPNMSYSTGFVDCGSFDFPYAGIFQGKCTLELESFGHYNIVSGKPSMMFSVEIFLYLDSVLIAIYDIAEMPLIDSEIFDLTRGIGAGKHTFRVMVRINNPYYDGNSSYQVYAKATFSNCKASADIRMARYFANGQAVGCSSTDYMETLIENNKLLHKVKCGDAGMEFNNGTMKICIGGVWYTATRDSKTKGLILT